MLDNTGKQAIKVNSSGQVPPRFNMDVTGKASYNKRQSIGSVDTGLKPDQVIASRCETPKSLADVTTRKHQYYTPIP